MALSPAAQAAAARLAAIVPADFNYFNHQLVFPQTGNDMGVIGNAIADEVALAVNAAANMIGTSTTSTAIGNGSKSFVTQAGKSFNVGRYVQIVSAANPTTRQMSGQITAYSGTSLTVDVTTALGSGSAADWTIYLSGPAGKGEPGDDGNTVLGGSGAPGSGDGIDGDFYIDTTANAIYGPKAAGAWGAGTSLVGPRGNAVLSGVGAPSSGAGINGDFYLDTSAVEIYGPKTAGSWGSGVALKGAAGKSVLTGSGAPAGGTGSDGDWYIDGTALRIYGPKTSGSWGAGVDMTGRTIHNGEGAPASGLGANGDYYFDTSGKRFYGPKTAGAWGAGILVEGSDGANGWTPVLVFQADGDRRVLQVYDWTGGDGTKPATGSYVGLGALVVDIADAIDLRGPSGSGSGDVSTSGAVAVNEIAIFADGTGDLIKSSGKTLPAGAIVGTTDTQTLSGKTLDANSNAIQNLDLTNFESGIVDADGALTANSDGKIPTQKAVRTFVGAYIAAQDVEVIKGGINCSTNPNYPAADAGHIYRVTAAGKIGGVSGPNVEVGDRLECFVDSSGAGTHASVGANWIVSQVNVDGAVVCTGSSVNGRIATFSGTSGKVIQDGGKALPSGDVVGTTDTQTLSGKTLTSPVISSPTGLVKADVGLGNVDNTSDADKPVSSETQSALDAKENLGELAGINTQTGTTYPLALADIGKVVEMNNSSAMTVTVPPNSTVAFPIGIWINLTRLGAGTLTIAEGSGVTVRSDGGKKKIASQYGMASLYKRGTNEWVLAGGLAS